MYCMWQNLPHTVQCCRPYGVRHIKLYNHNTTSNGHDKTKPCELTLTHLHISDWHIPNDCPAGTKTPGSSILYYIWMTTVDRWRLSLKWHRAFVKGEGGKRGRRGQKRKAEFVWESISLRHRFLSCPSERQRGGKAKDKNRDGLCLVYHCSRTYGEKHTHTE